MLDNNEYRIIEEPKPMSSRHITFLVPKKLITDRKTYDRFIESRFRGNYDDYHE